MLTHRLAATLNLLARNGIAPGTTVTMVEQAEQSPHGLSLQVNGIRVHHCGPGSYQIFKVL